MVETSRRLLAAFGSLDQLANATYEEIVAKRIPGIGETKALQIVAAIEFGRRCSYAELMKSMQCNEKYIQSSEDVYNILIAWGTVPIRDKTTITNSRTFRSGIYLFSFFRAPFLRLQNS